MSSTVVAARNRFLSALEPVNELVAKNATVPGVLPYENWTGKRVLFIYAHIDDMEGAAGGLTSLLQGKA